MKEVEAFRVDTICKSEDRLPEEYRNLRFAGEIKPLPGTMGYKEIEHPGASPGVKLALILASQIFLWLMVLMVVT
jgi:hypothetical protein